MIAKLLAMLLLGLAVGLLVGFLFGLKQGAFRMALQENKVAVDNLRMSPTNLTPQLREYLKARIYCNVYTFYPNETAFLTQTDWDFGPVDKNVLGRIFVFRDPNQIVWDWAG